MTLNEINEIIKQWRRESSDKRAVLIISSEVTGENGQQLVAYLVSGGEKNVISMVSHAIEENESLRKILARSLSVTEDEYVFNILKESWRNK